MIFYYGPLRHVCKPFMQSIISHNQSCLECSYLADCTIISKLSSYSVHLSFQAPFVHGFLYMIFYYGSLRHVCKPFMQTIISHNQSCFECLYLSDCTIISKLSSYSVPLSFQTPFVHGFFYMIFYYGSLRHVCKPFMQSIISHNQSCLECGLLKGFTYMSQ